MSNVVVYYMLFLFCKLQLAEKEKAPRVHSLEYALHSLLRKQHHKTQTLVTPRPVTAYPMQGGNKRLCLAGASGMTAAEVTPYLQRFVDHKLSTFY